MNDPRVVLLIAIGLVGLCVVIFALMRTKRRTRLRAQFGPEYDRTVEELGSESRAASELNARRARVARLDVRRLSRAEADRFADEWRAIQARFVDDPRAAIAGADEAVQRLMEARGYPVGDFEERVADVSVHHANVVDHYREARAIAINSERGSATTEDLRRAIQLYRSLFDDLLETDWLASQRMEVPDERAS
jgi:antitoxin component HigA of HigAB toxin-antitoxin module